MRPCVANKANQIRRPMENRLLLSRFTAHHRRGRRQADNAEVNRCDSWHVERFPQRVALPILNPVNGPKSQTLKNQHIHSRPSNMRQPSSVIRFRRVHRGAHGGVCCVDGDI